MEYIQYPNQSIQPNMSLVMFHEWEPALLKKARAGLAHRIATTREHLIQSDLLRKAYAYCSEVTRQNSRTFYMASALVPPAKQNATRAMYAFCRACDDLMDRPTSENPLEDLEQWRMKTSRLHPYETNLITLAWHDTRLTYSIPSLYAEQLIEGVKIDSLQKRHQTFAQLTEYCYGAASTVGLMPIHIVGFRHHQALLYAVRLALPCNSPTSCVTWAKTTAWGTSTCRVKNCSPSVSVKRILLQGASPKIGGSSCNSRSNAPASYIAPPCPV